MGATNPVSLESVGPALVPVHGSGPGGWPRGLLCFFGLHPTITVAFTL